MDPTKEEELITHLCRIIENGHISTEQLKLQLQAIPNRDRLEWETCSPLISAAKRGSRKYLKMMIERLNFDVNSTTKNGSIREWCALAVSIHQGNFCLAKFLIARPKINLELFTSKILSQVLFWGNFESVQFVLQHLKPDINSKMINGINPEKGFLPLHYAITRDFAK